MASKNQWAFDIKDTIPTLIKVTTRPQLQKKYPKIFYTTEEEVESTPVFPTVLIILIDQKERGRTLEGNIINSVYAKFKVEVTTNVSRADCDYVTTCIGDKAKEMEFDVVGPIPSKYNKIYKNVLTISREISANDRLL